MVSGVKDKRKAVSKRQTHNTPKTKMAEQREHIEMSKDNKQDKTVIANQAISTYQLIISIHRIM